LIEAWVGWIGYFGSLKNFLATIGVPLPKGGGLNSGINGFKGAYLKELGFGFWIGYLGLGNFLANKGKKGGLI